MPQRNRDKIMRQSLYDLLCKMNDMLKNENHAEVSFVVKLGEKEHIATESACIMDCFYKSDDVTAKCDAENCAKCIQEWLNSYPF